MNGKVFLTTLACGAAAVAIGTPACARAAKAAAAARAQDRATNGKMLAALLQRRAAIVSSPGHSEGKRSALDIVDRQIARVKAELGG